MKKSFVSLALLAALALGATAANAATIKATGSWQIDANVGTENDFNSQTKDNTFSIGQRMRTAFQFIANENLKGVLETQIGTNAWGNGLYQVGAGRSPSTAAGGALSAGSGNLILRKGYLDFKWPNTSVNFLVGYQSLALPSAMGVGSAILDDHVAGAAAVVPINKNISLVGGYVRPIDANTYGTTGVAGTGTQADAAFLFANLDYTGFKVSPFLAYAYSGHQATLAGVSRLGGMLAPNALPADAAGMRAYWAGTAFTMTAFEPFKVMADLNYGSATFNSGSQEAGRKGWMGDVAVAYTGLSMMTPELFFAYSSGEDKNGQKSERMPSLSAENWSYGTFWMQGGDSLGTSYNGPGSALGFWAVGLSLKDIKFIDKLSHTFHLIYFKGTNAKEYAATTNASYGGVLTEKDHLVEIDLNSKYQIYEELSLGLELGYIAASFDKTIWSAKTGYPSSKLSEDAFKATFMLNYSF